MCLTRAWRSPCFASTAALNLDEDWGGVQRVVSPATRVTDEELEAQVSQLQSQGPDPSPTPYVHTLLCFGGIFYSEDSGG